MEISDYEQYYQKGGTYVLPIEVFNELWGEMKNWEDTCKQKDNIIKEVREIFKYYGVKEDILGYSNYIITGDDLIKLLEILDKDNK